MNNKHNNPQDDDYVFKPPGFFLFYLQRIFIWGQWSIAQARYFYRRDLLRYQQYQAQRKTNDDEGSR